MCPNRRAEVITSERVRTFRDLRGKRIAIMAPRDPYHLFIASIAAHLGLKPDTEINWVTPPYAEWNQLLAEGKIDAVFAGPPQLQELRARIIGRTVVNMLTDRPWSQYFCCILVGNKEFARRYPVATKRAMRAILKASDVCAPEPENVVRFLVDRGYAERSDFAVQAMKEIALRKVAGVRRRRHRALLFAQAPRGRPDQVEPTKDPHSGYRRRFLNEPKKELNG